MLNSIVRRDRPAWEPNRSTRNEVVATHGVGVSFGGLRALDNVNLEINSGEILGLIGPNGAGKTTLINVVTGFQTPSDGDVMIDGRSCRSVKAHRRAALGVVRTFQAVRLFGDSTVVENVEVAALCRPGNRQLARARSLAAIEAVGLGARADVAAGQLPYGEERLVGIARALAAEPSHLFLDEPAAGMNEAETAALENVLQRVREVYSCGIVLVEHDFGLIRRIADRVHVLDRGRTLATGSAEEVRHDERVVAAYLGDSVDDDRTSDGPHTA